MIRPLVGCSKPAIMRSVVVLPQPEGPSSVKNSPGGISISIASTATTSSKRFVSCWSAISPCTSDLEGGDGGRLAAAGVAPVEEEREPERGEREHQRDRRD